MWRIGRAPNSIPIYSYIQQDATLHSLFISGSCSACFGWYFHPSSGAHTTVSTASGICHTVTAICRYRGRVGTGLSVLWEGNYSTYFGWNFHPLSGAHTTISTASGICRTVTAICRYRGRDGTGLSVLWVAYFAHSTLKPDAVDTVYALLMMGGSTTRNM